MRLYNEQEETEKIIQVEDYSTFKQLLESKHLFVALIAYTAFIVVNAVLAMLDKGYIMGVVSLICQGLICASLWIFRLNNAKNEGLTTKGTNMFQIAHAIKYVILFIFLVILLFMIIFSWINAANLAHQAVVSAESSTEEGVLAAAKAASRKVFWSYFGILIFYLLFIVGTCNYYTAVMKTVDSYVKYVNKGTHFWKTLKFLSIYLFVTAGIAIFMSILCCTGAVNSMLSLVNENTSFATFAGGTGVISSIGRIIFAGICIYLGMILRKGYNVLESTKTYHEEVVKVE